MLTQDISFIVYKKITEDFQVQLEIMKVAGDFVRSGQDKLPVPESLFRMIANILGYEIVGDVPIDIEINFRKHVALESSNSNPTFSTMFIPVDEGFFTIDNTFFPVVPFHMYEYENAKKHSLGFNHIEIISSEK